MSGYAIANPTYSAPHVLILLAPSDELDLANQGLYGIRNLQVTSPIHDLL
jgi:hypothetical protein